jgi:TRAP-type C4-dicarboxylate transport system substrate-binding protein
MQRRATCLGLAVLLVVLGGERAAEAQVAPQPAPTQQLRIATPMPKGSAWATVLQKAAQEIDANTGGRVTVKLIFSSQPAIASVDGVVVGNAGLAALEPNAVALSIPGLAADEMQLDALLVAARPVFDKLFAAKGYVLAAWVHIGPVHLYSAGHSLADVAGVAATVFWVWQADVVMQTVLASLGASMVTGTFPAAQNMLQTGQIAGLYGSPLSAVALQSYARLNYATDRPIAFDVGGLVLRDAALQGLTAADRRVVLDAFAAAETPLRQKTRTDNERARKAMQKNGIVFEAPTPALETALRQATLAAWQQLAPTLSPDLIAALGGVPAGVTALPAGPGSPTVTIVAPPSHAPQPPTTPAPPAAAAPSSAAPSSAALSAVGEARDDLAVLRLQLESCDAATFAGWVRFPLLVRGERVPTPKALAARCRDGDLVVPDAAELPAAQADAALDGDTLVVRFPTTKQTWRLRWIDSAWQLVAID